jgi:hypothetical protein
MGSHLVNNVIAIYFYNFWCKTPSNIDRTCKVKSIIKFDDKVIQKEI